MTRKLLFLNSHRAKSGNVDGQALSPEYVLLSRFFGCGPIDRTGTLDMGVDYGVLQEIPPLGTDTSFAEICDLVAEDIIDQAIEADCALQVTWSGGIDSTVALLSLITHLKDKGELERLFVLLSLGSMAEYPWFYEHFIAGRLQTRPLPVPLPQVLRDDALTVTGEHGDQLFGSDHLVSLVKGGVAQLPYRHVVPFYITSKLKCGDQAARVMEYLAPQVAAAPVPIETAFDYLWWVSYSLKWQQVSLRIPVFRRTQVGELYPKTRHFFADPRFQSWSLANPQVRKVRDWRAYKLEAKKLILDATGDFDYFVGKEKAPSLKDVLVDRRRQGKGRHRVHMYDDYKVHFETFEKTG